MRLPRPLSTLRARLIVGYLAVCAVGVGTLFVTVRLTAPSFFDSHLGNMAGVQHSGQRLMRGAASAAELDAAMSKALNQGLLVATIAALAIGVVVSVVLSRQVTGQVRRLAQASARIAGGEYSHRVTAEGPPEFAELASSFNAMAASLEDTERRRRELIGDVAHELRTPVAVLRGYIEGLADGVFPTTPETWTKLEQETARLGTLVEELGELSRAESGALPLSLVPVDPQRAIETAVARLRTRFVEKGLVLTIDVPAALPQVTADPDRLVQVLTNLLMNALNYTPVPGEVALICRESAGWVSFAVRDTGIGIAPDDLERVFERFYRVDPSRARASGGSGVGLTIARALAAAMAGTLTAESAGAHLGSMFTLRLPVADAGGRSREPLLEPILNKPVPRS